MFFCVILHAHIGYTQLQLPVYTDYLTNNYFLVHPSMAGAQLEGLKVRMTHRLSGQEFMFPPVYRQLTHTEE